MQPRHPPRVTHLCSIRLTHGENAGKGQAISSLTHRIQAVRAEVGLSCVMVLLVLLAISGVWANNEPSTSQKDPLARQAYRVAAVHLVRRESGNVLPLKSAPFSPERATLLSDGKYLIALPYLISGVEETVRVRIAHTIVNCTVTSCDVDLPTAEAGGIIRK
jgi:hypothetical protein